MTKEDINGVYQAYRKRHEKTIKIEEALLTVSNQDEWIMKLSQKSTFLRAAYKENEEMLNQVIRPVISGEVALNDEMADAFLSNIIEMEIETENDSAMTTELLKVLITYYNRVHNMENEILATFFLGISYADKVNPVSVHMAYDCFDRVCSFAPHYTEIQDWDIRRRMVFAFYNRFTNYYDRDRFDDKCKLFTLLEETAVFCKREDVRELDSQNIDFDEFYSECADSVQWSLVCTDEKPAEETLAYVERNLLNGSINEENLFCQKSSLVITYLWYHYWHGDYNCNRVIELLYAYYCDKNKEIDYTAGNFYDTEEYQIQMVYMQECFRYLALPECRMSNGQEILDDLKKDFVRLYESIPYLNNNAYLNVDMIEIMKLMLRTVKDKDEAFEHIREVVIRRNAMTLIHSTMMGKIAEEIIKCLINHAPEMFYILLDTDNPEEIRKQKDFLTEYIRNAAYLHDIGKLEIADIINQQTRRLTDEEFYLIKKHPEFGFKMIEKTILEEMYGSFILGHHKFYDDNGGYPETFVIQNDRRKILIDILTVSDCIDAATDMLGRNYTMGKTWIPTVQEELLADDNHRYNKQLVQVLCKDKEVCDVIHYLTGLGRVRIYYDIYLNYIKE